MSKDTELESARRHFETIDTFWGRPGIYQSIIYSNIFTNRLAFQCVCTCSFLGHGAPKQNVKTKLNLNDLLYKPWS